MLNDFLNQYINSVGFADTLETFRENTEYSDRLAQLGIYIEQLNNSLNNYTNSMRLINRLLRQFQILNSDFTLPRPSINPIEVTAFDWFILESLYPDIY